MIQKRKCKLTACAALLIAAACWAQDRSPFVILPASQADAVNQLCSRSAPGRVEGGWVPDAKDVATLETRLGDISKLESSGALRMTISNPYRFYRQYVGIVVNGRRLIYLNAFTPDHAPKSWQTRLVNVCDGGSTYWGVLFDPTTAKFSDLKTNGVG